MTALLTSALIYIYIYFKDIDIFTHEVMFATDDLKAIYTHLHSHLSHGMFDDCLNLIYTIPVCRGLKKCVHVYLYLE